MACGLRRTSTSSPDRMFRIAFRYVKTLGIRDCLSKLYQHFRVRDHPYGLQDSLPTLSPSCSPSLAGRLRHGPKARYGWVASPYKDTLQHLLPTGTFTLLDTPSLSRRDNVLLTCGPSWRWPCASMGCDRLERQVQLYVMRSPQNSTITS